MHFRIAQGAERPGVNYLSARAVAIEADAVDYFPCTIAGRARRHFGDRDIAGAFTDFAILCRHGSHLPRYDLA